MLKFGDHLSNALHEIKRHSGKKIGVLMDELGYRFEPELSGDTIESWRYRKAPPTLAHLETLARLIIGYQAAVHDREWLDIFLQSAEHPYPQAICDELFPAETAQPEPNTQKPPHPVVNTLPPPPLKAYAPPAVSGFVGRQPDLNRYKESLKKQTFAAISGMAGVGKTTLMSRLAAELTHEHTVFWHSFASGTVEPMVVRLTGFIANFGRPELWEMLEAARTTGGRPPAVETLFDMLSVILGELSKGELSETVLLCLDDLQFVDEDVRLQPFLLKMFDHKNVNVLITTRRYPSFFPAGHEQQLVGLDESEAADLLLGREVSLPQNLIVRLTELTGGNGAFLTLAAVILKDALDPEEIIGRLAREDDVERFLMEEVNDRLGNNEQRVMEAVAILSGYPGTRNVLEEMLNMRDVRRTLRGLADQYLLLTGEDDDGERVYSQHQMIQSFFYDQPRSSRRRDLHMKAADFYEFEEPDPLRAMLHHAKVGQLAPLASLADARFYDVVNQGEGRSLLTILAEVAIEQSNLPGSQIIKFLLARGRLQNILGELKTAEVDLKQAAEMLNTMPQTAETEELKCEVCLAMGELLERQDPPEALLWVQRGLGISQTAELSILEGMLHYHMGNFGEALESLHDGLEDLSADRQLERGKALNMLGAVNGSLGKMAEAKAYSLQALELSRAIGDHVEVSQSLSNLGWFRYVLGERQAAVNDLESGVLIAQQLGSKDTEMSLQVNLGASFVEMGNSNRAKHHLGVAVELAETYGSNLQITALYRLGELAIKEENWSDAEQFLFDAEQLALAKNDQAALAGLYGFQALALVGQGDLIAAETLVKKGVSLDKMLGDPWSLGINLRIYGQIFAHKNQLDEAQKYFKQSVATLENVDAYQAAITCFEWGKAMAQSGEPSAAIDLIQQANREFKKHEISPELTQSNQFLEGIIC